MSTADQEARALALAQEFLRDLGSGRYKVTSIRALRAEARDILRHYPLDPEGSWLRLNGGIE